MVERIEVVRYTPTPADFWLADIRTLFLYAPISSYPAGSLDLEASFRFFLSVLPYWISHEWKISSTSLKGDDRAGYVLLLSSLAYFPPFSSPQTSRSKLSHSMRFPADQNRIAEEAPGGKRVEVFRRATNCRIRFPTKVTVQYQRAIVTCFFVTDFMNAGKFTLTVYVNNRVDSWIMLSSMISYMCINK